MRKKFLIFGITVLSLSACNNNKSALDWEGCELKEPPHIKAKRDSLATVDSLKLINK